MSDKPVWMYDWEAVGDRPEYCIRTGLSRAGAFFRDRDERNLAAAAPALVRALLASEWHAFTSAMYGEARNVIRCPVCDETYPLLMVRKGDTTPEQDLSHTAACSLDAALTAAGFPTQASRDEARKLMAAT